MNYTYILQCKDGSLYTGWTNDIEKRLGDHRSGRGARYTKGRGPLELIYLEVSDSRSQAMRREAWIKRLTRQKEADFDPKQRLERASCGMGTGEPAAAGTAGRGRNNFCGSPDGIRERRTYACYLKN